MLLNTRESRWASLTTLGSRSVSSQACTGRLAGRTGEALGAVLGAVLGRHWGAALGELARTRREH
jgi:hypothetical protein